LQAQNTKDKALKTKYMFWHKSFGLLAAGLLGPRVLARVLSKSPGPVVGANAIEATAGSLGHLAMYGFAFVLPVSGVIMGAFSGFGLPFFYTTIPSIEKKPDIAKQAYEIHKIAGQVFEYFVPIHVGGALYHVFRGHSVFARITGLGNAANKSSKVAK
jgi:cytochrome b561